LHEEEGMDEVINAHNSSDDDDDDDAAKVEIASRKRYGKGNCSSRITQMSKNMASHGSLYSIKRNKCKYLVLFSYLQCI
jgi:hypothetical protein